MSFKVHKGGLLTTVQDGGRRGYQSVGMPVAGCIDMHSFQIANMLVGNDLNEAVLECTVIGPTLEFLSDAVVAITGADLMPLLNEKPMPMYRAVQIKAGDEISMRMIKSGCRAYIAFAGGMDIPEVMGSKSTYYKAGIGGYEGRRLGNGDEIKLKEPNKVLPNMEKRFIEPQIFGTSAKVRVLMGPQDDYFTDKGVATFLSEEYTVTDKFDRMGVRTTGPKIEHKTDANILSDGISFGAIQVPDSGEPIIMLSDRQTVGGYTKIATIINVDMPLVAQLKVGDRISFEKTDIETAQQEYIDYIHELERLEAEFDKLDEPVAKEPEKESGVLKEGESFGPGKQYVFTIDGIEYEVAIEEI